jgi:hypothetical protein
MAETPNRTGDARRPCRNCGQPAGPGYCGSCGQPVDDRRRPLWRVVEEMVDDWLSLDSRLLRTLGALARPGRLTLLHRDGKRAPYLRPLRLYLLASVALFSTLLTMDPPDAADVNLYIGGELVSEATNDERAKDIQLVGRDSFFGRRLETIWADKFDTFREQPPQQLLDSLFTSMRRYFPAALFLFVPFLAAGLKLLYRKTGTLYLDHLVFALHFQSALFLALVAVWLIVWALGVELLPSLLGYVGMAVLMLTAYLGLALGRVHRQGRWWTIAKVVLVLFVYQQLLGLSLGLAVSAAIWQA